MKDHPEIPPGCEALFEEVGGEWCVADTNGTWTQLSIVLRDRFAYSTARLKFLEVKCRARCACYDLAGDEPKNNHAGIHDDWLRWTKLEKEWRDWGRLNW